MSAAFDNAPAFHVQNHAGVDGLGKIVGDEKSRALGMEPLKSFEDCGLVPFIQAGRRLIKDEDGGIANSGPGDRDPLALALRKSHATLAENCLVTQRQSRDEFVRIGEARCGFDFRGRSTRRRAPDVLANRGCKEHIVLQYDAYLGTQRFKGELTNIMTIDQHPALHRIVKPQNQTEQSALAATGRADHYDMLPRLDIELDL